MKLADWSGICSKFLYSNRASLTSFFSVPNYGVDFVDLQTLLESDYYLIIRGNDAVQQKYRESESGSLDARVVGKVEEGKGQFLVTGEQILR